MIYPNEIDALLRLIEDPDDFVFQQVSQKIFSVGNTLIPRLEAHWECQSEMQVQDRIEWLIHKIQFEDLKLDLHVWANDPDGTVLLDGCLLASKYFYPAQDETVFLQSLNRLKNMLWLELNDFLTPLEQFHIVNSILYHFFKLSGSADLTDVNRFLLPKVIESKKGNAFSNALLFLILSESFELPIRIVDLPGLSLLAVFPSGIDLNYDPEIGKGAPSKILFFIDATQGSVFTMRDVELYYYRKGISLHRKYFAPQSHNSLISNLFKKMSECFSSDELLYKQGELLELSHILDLD